MGKKTKRVVRKVKKKVLSKKTSTKKVSKEKALKSKKAAKIKVPKKKQSLSFKDSSSKKTTGKKTAGPKISPLRDRILIRPKGLSQRTAGGLYIPDTVTAERPSQGLVMAVGSGAVNKKGKLRPLDVTVGIEVLYAQQSGTSVRVLDEELLVLREDEILGIVE